MDLISQSKALSYFDKIFDVDVVHYQLRETNNVLIDADTV